MKKTFAFLTFLSFFASPDLFAATKTYTVSKSDIQNGFIIERVNLNSYDLPAVHFSNPVFTPVSALPKGAAIMATGALKLIMGMERKQPFVLVSTPAFSKNDQGELQQLSSFTLDITETGIATTAPALKGTSVNSVLATGTWYKIAVPSRGVYKVDYNFIQSQLGVSGTINSANIRVFGNGGTMLSEANNVPRAEDLVENALSVNDGGDGTLNGSDYFTFYANGPMAWVKDSVGQRFTHRKNLYADSSYYFVCFDKGAGLRIANQQGVPAANYTVTSFNDYAVHEEDLYNPGKFGKEWIGEKMGNLTTAGLTTDINFPVGNVLDSATVRVSLADRSSTSGALFNVALNGQSFSSNYFSAVTLGEDTDPQSMQLLNIKAPVAGGTAAFHLTYTPAVNDGIGYLDFIELNYRRSLSFSGGVLPFRDWQSVSAGRIASYQLANANSNTAVWDVTNPLQPVHMNGTLSGSQYTFTQDAASLHEFVALDGSQYSTPQYAGKVANQDLHGSTAVDFIIVTAPEFLTASNKLADFHRQHDNMRVLVATTDQVYNEFSSGGQDISAIRDFARMFYDRAGTDTTQMPKNLLLFGDASYDYKNRIANNSNHVPTFESAQSISISSSYVVDEFFAMLDANENIEDITIANTLDIGIGRLPANTASDADAIVNKIINYTNPSSLGPWRIANTFIGDNEDDAGPHLQDAEDMGGVVNATTKELYNDTKIYLDNLPFVSTPAGERCPDGNKAINDAIYKGTFLINFNGHGSIYTLTHERILTADDFNLWKNSNKLPFMVTATCDFSRYDNPEYVSAGEKIIMKGDGGAIAMLTTTAAVYAGVNHIINEQFLASQFNQQNGQWPTFGEAYRKGKNLTYLEVPDFGTLINNRRFILLGDPALQPCFPKFFVHTDSVIDMATNQATDSFKALGGYTVSGSVADLSHQTMENFNGRVYVTIYDKPRVVSLNTKVYGTPRSYKVQDNIIYKGIANVDNGRFNFSFIAPKDINYAYGRGKISYYAENGSTDAAGIDTGQTVGGFSDKPVTDNDGPIVKPYMNDTLFRNGAVTGANTTLYVQLSDETGINASGNSVGHDITAILDGKTSAPNTLNDYYVTEPNTYKKGHLNFPMAGLSNGRHTITVTAWDVNNNSGEGTVNFEVADGKIIAIQNLMNYPNPFSDVTHFIFEHNHPDEAYKVQIAIYSTDGRQMKMIEQSFTPSGSHSNEITWDGTDNKGAKLPTGVYPYKMVLSTANGIEAAAYQKLVLIR